MGPYLEHDPISVVLAWPISFNLLFNLLLRRAHDCEYLKGLINEERCGPDNQNRRWTTQVERYNDLPSWAQKT